jgi:hypothetical protein
MTLWHQMGQDTEKNHQSFGSACPFAVNRYTLFAANPRAKSALARKPT